MLRVQNLHFVHVFWGPKGGFDFFPKTKDFLAPTDLLSSPGMPNVSTRRSKDSWDVVKFLEWFLPPLRLPGSSFVVKMDSKPL